MCGPLYYRWLPVIAFLLALPAAPQPQSGFSAAPSSGENSAAATASADIPVADRSPATRPQLPPETMGDLLRVRGQYQAAIELYSKIQQPSAAVWNGMGIAYQMLFDPKDATRCYNEALKLDPGNIYALNNLGTVEESVKDYRAAERNYRAALKINPHYTTALRNLGTALMMQHQYEKGFALYEQALAIDPHIFDDNSRRPATVDPGLIKDKGAVNYFKARSCALAGLNDCAVAFLRKAFSEGSATVNKVANDSAFESVRGNPELELLLAQQQ